MKFNNIYIDKIWGGRDFNLFRNNPPDGKVGESWDVSCYEDGMSTIINGEYAGKTLKEVINFLNHKIVGNKVDPNNFPIMLRLVNPREKLSVQVHPTDEYAKKREMVAGKTEAWYILETFEDPFVYAATKDCTINEFKNAIANGTVEKHLKKFKVQKGDVILLERGIVHAMGHNLIVVEIGQNSNTTYRVYDYGRGRELNLDDAFNVINLNLSTEISKGLVMRNDGYDRTIFFIHEAFAWEQYDIKSECRLNSDTDRFIILTCVEGHGILQYNGGVEYIKYGESILIPAYLGEYVIIGELKLLKSYVPDIQKIKEEISNVIRL